MSRPSTTPVLNFANANLSKVVGQHVTRIQPYESGLQKLDTFLALGPSVVKFVVGDGYFLQTRTIDCSAINHIEFAGDETEAEAVVRRKHVKTSDVSREITPVVFARYHKQTGQRSPKHLAIATHARTAEVIREMPRDGGSVELENWERERMTLTTDKGNGKLEVTFSGATKTNPSMTRSS